MECQWLTDLTAGDGLALNWLALARNGCGLHSQCVHVFIHYGCVRARNKLICLYRFYNNCHPSNSVIVSVYRIQFKELDMLCEQHCLRSGSCSWGCTAVSRLVCPARQIHKDFCEQDTGGVVSCLRRYRCLCNASADSRRGRKSSPQ